jgi:hypothetical protein
MVNVPICFCATSCVCLENLRKSYEKPHPSRLPLCALELRLSPEVGQSPMAFNFECMVPTFLLPCAECQSYASCACAV